MFAAWALTAWALPLLPISLYTLSAVIASLLFYFSYQVLALERLPLGKYTLSLLREQYEKVLRYESIHTGLVLLYLSGVVGCILISLESTKNMKLTVAQLGTSFIMVLYPVVDMRRIVNKRKQSIEVLWKEKNVALFEESMRCVEVDYFKGERKEELRECFADFPVFPVDQLREYAKELGRGGYKESNEVLIHGWIRERVNQVNEYKQFYQISSYTFLHLEGGKGGEKK